MSSTTHPVPVRQRWTALTLTRLGIAAAAAAAVAGIPALAGDRAPAVLATCGLYAMVVVATELVRRHRESRALWLMGALVVLDCFFLARVVNATGGTPSPLNALVYLHVVAVTLVVSFRTGLQAAALHATLVVLPAMAMDPGLVDSTLGAVPSGAALRATSYLLVAIATAAFASIDEGALRRSQARLLGQVDLLSDLDETHSVEAAALVVGRHVVSALGFTRAAVTVIDGDEARVVVVERHGEQIHHVIAALPATADLSVVDGLEEGRPLLLGALDAERWSALDDLVPGATDLVVVPMVAGENRCGAIVAEWPGGRRHRIDLSVVDELVLTARFGGMALRSAFLLAEVEDRSRRDLVTGLGNRRYFQEALEREVSRTRRAESELSIVLLDLDRFKAVNDLHGHLAGDAVLEAVGRALSDAGRAHDTVARIGGDEFAMLLTDCGEDDARAVAERARKKVWEVVGDRGVTACAGVVTAPADGCRPRDLVHQADKALYAAKAAGRNRVEVAPPPRAGETILDLVDVRPPSVGAASARAS